MREISFGSSNVIMGFKRKKKKKKEILKYFIEKWVYYINNDIEDANFMCKGQKREC